MSKKSTEPKPGKSRERPYKITNEQALLTGHPHLFKTVPDHTRIRASLSAGWTLPGVEMVATPIEEAAQGGATPQPVKRL